jgi:hypothetical protein
MNQDEQHLHLLSIFHYVAGGLTALVSCFGLIYVAMGLLFANMPFDAKDAPPVAFGWVFFGIGTAFVLAGWTVAVLIIIAGKRLAQHRSRTFCLVIAAIECLVQPYGTVLGVFTIVVLMKDSVTQMFAVNDSPGEGGIERPTA